LNEEELQNGEIREVFLPVSTHEPSCHWNTKQNILV